LDEESFKHASLPQEIWVWLNTIARVAGWLVKGLAMLYTCKKKSVINRFDLLLSVSY
jgi:hypothetical protein